MRIEVGQVWQEKAGARRVARVIINSPRYEQSVLTPLSGGINNVTKKWDEIRAKWELVRDAPPAGPSRRISLSIAPATETHCQDEQQNRCKALDPSWPRCDALGGEPEYDSDALRFKRLPACIEAELP